MYNKPRILYILHNPLEVACGTEQHTRALFAGLKDHYDTWVVFPHRGTIALSNDGVSATGFPAAEVDRYVPPYRVPVIGRSLRAIFDQVQPDLVHIQHFIHWPLNVIDLSAELGNTVILSLHDHYAITPEYTLSTTSDARNTLSTDYALTAFGKDISIYLQQRREVIRASFARVARRVVPSTYLAGVISSVFPTELDVIPHGIPAFEIVRKPADRDRFVFGYVGKLLSLKGWDLLLRAFSGIRDKYPNAELHFYGGYQPDGDRMQQYRRYRRPPF